MKVKRHHRTTAASKLCRHDFKKRVISDEIDGAPWCRPI